MAASAADVRSILSLPGPSSTPVQSQKKVQVPSARKPDGISRELYSLIGPSAPSLAAQFAKPRLKQKPNFGSGGSRTKWEWRPFKNGAREDGLRLSHWVKASTDPDADYPFSRYNVQPNKYFYSTEEYARLLEDPEWTQEETDYLFKTVLDYDSRWYVIHDRYEYPNGPPRTIEDLKDRYYGVCRKLVRDRPWSGDEASKAQLLSSLEFDKHREEMRKKYILSLENRTPKQVAEEEALYVEIKRLEQSERRFKKDREELLRTLAGVESGLPDIPVDEEGQVALVNDTKRKKRMGSAIELDSPLTPNIISLGPPITKRVQTAKSAAYDAQQCITRVDPPPATTPATKAAHQPVFLRSFKIPTPKTSVAPKVAQALGELGISYSRLVMPTRENCAQLEALLEATTGLVELKKLVDKVEYDIKVVKARLGHNASAEPDGAQQQHTEVAVAEEVGGGGGGGGEVGGGVGDGRAQSVVSTRSVRSRKHARRSGSVSSTDTTATVSTRAGLKRQKRQV